MSRFDPLAVAPSLRRVRQASFDRSRRPPILDGLGARAKLNDPLTLLSSNQAPCDERKVFISLVKEGVSLKGSPAPHAAHSTTRLMVFM